MGAQARSLALERIRGMVERSPARWGAGSGRAPYVASAAAAALAEARAEPTHKMLAARMSAIAISTQSPPP